MDHYKIVLISMIVLIYQLGLTFGDNGKWIMNAENIDPNQNWQRTVIINSKFTATIVIQWIFFFRYWIV